MARAPAIRHAGRCVMFRPPLNEADLANALADALVDTPAGKMLVYRVGKPDGQVARIMGLAANLSARIEGCALVTWPNAGPDNLNRTWCWAIQRRGRA